MSLSRDSIKTLVVSDQETIIKALTNVLVPEGHQLTISRNAYDCLHVLRTSPHDLLVVDADLQLISGYYVAEAVRKEASVPLIMLASCAEETECVKSLELGADDCINKPIRPQEFVLRVRNTLLRHWKKATPGTGRAGLAFIPPIYNRDFVIDVNHHEVKVRGQDVYLPLFQFRFLHLLASSPKRVFSYAHLLQYVWGEESPYADSHKLKVNVIASEVRKKIEVDPAHPKHLLTVRGVGYQFYF